MNKATSKIGSAVGRVVAERANALFRKYVIEEALAPIRLLGRRLLFGTVGALLIAIGAVVALVAFLRLLDSETGSTFAGNWSFAPYLITAAAGVLALGAFVTFAFKGATGQRIRSGRRRHKA